LKKEGYTKIAKSSQQACKLLFSWGWMVVDKLARSINFEKNGGHHTNGISYSILPKFSASNFVSTAILKKKKITLQNEPFSGTVFDDRTMLSYQLFKPFLMHL
jgi:hypothetical protein